MKKLILLITVSIVFVVFNSCQKEASDPPEATPEILLNQDPEFIELQSKCNSMSKMDVIAILEKKGEKVVNGFSLVDKGTTNLKNISEPDPGSITLSAEAKFDIKVVNGIPKLVSLMKWHWNTGGTVGICAADYAGPDWIYHMKYYWLDISTEEIHYIRTRGNSCIYDGTGSQDVYYRSQNLKIVSVIGKWFLYNKKTGEEIATSGAYVPSSPLIAFTKK